MTVAVGGTSYNPVTGVDISLNSVFLINNVPPPFQATSTVPYGVTSLTIGARARDASGIIGWATPITVSVASDPLTTVQGRVTDRQGTAVAAANVALKLNGLKAEFFQSSGPLTSFPDLTGRTPDAVKPISRLDFRNPNGLFGNDTFGTGLGSFFAARFTGLLRIPAPGIYTFTLGASGGGSVLINTGSGNTPVAQVVSTSQPFAEGSGTIALPAGNLPIEIDYFAGAATPEVQLSAASVTATGGQRLRWSPRRSPMPRKSPAAGPVFMERGRPRPPRGFSRLLPAPLGRQDAGAP